MHVKHKIKDFHFPPSFSIIISLLFFNSMTEIHPSFFILHLFDCQLGCTFFSVYMTFIPALSAWPVFLFSDEKLPHFFLIFWWMCTGAKLFQSQPILCDHMDYRLPGSSVHGILHARILEWVATTFSRNWYAKYLLLLLLLFSCSALCDPMDCSTPGFPVFTITQRLFKLMSIESVMLSNHFILCRPLLLPPSIFTNIWVFSNESALCIRWLKYWSVSFSISHSNEYSGLISFRIDSFDLLAVQDSQECSPTP